jgi:hypothetical protein
MEGGENNCNSTLYKAGKISNMANSLEKRNPWKILIDLQIPNKALAGYEGKIDITYNTVLLRLT